MHDASPSDSTTPITMYWRPGCGFCSALRRGLQGAGLNVHEVNIWEDEKAAAFVRSVAGGNEIVPTISVGDAALVNPSVAEVIDLVGL
jgi:mycoredoxin